MRGGWSALFCTAAYCTALHCSALYCSQSLHSDNTSLMVEGGAGWREEDTEDRRKRQDCMETHTPVMINCKENYFCDTSNQQAARGGQKTQIVSI